MTKESRASQGIFPEILLLIEHEDLAAARMELSGLRGKSSGEQSLVDLLLLDLKICIAERNLEAARGLIAELEKNQLNLRQLQECRLLSAYAEALDGTPRYAIRMVSEMLRDCGPFEEMRARASYVAGVSLLRGGHYKWSRIYLERAIAYYRLDDKAVQLSRVLNSLALLEKCVGRLDLALAHFDQAVGLLPENLCWQHRRRILINRGVCLLKLGRLKEAKLNLLQAADLSVRSRDHHFDVSINNNLGHTYRMEGDCEAAESYYLKALERARESSSRRQECLSLEFLGELYLEMGRLEAAGDYLMRAHRIAQELAPHGDLMMEILRRRGELKMAMGKREEARSDLVLAVRLCRSRGEIRERRLSERALAFLEASSAKGLQARLPEILDGIRSLGDRFEYLRTVVQAIEKYGEPLAEAPWFRASIVTATHYAESLGFDHWKERLNRGVGYARELIPRDGSDRAEEEEEFLLASESSLFAQCLEAAHLASRSDSSVLISGETGVGKEVVARLVHEQSARADGPLVAINCGALPEGLLESELFGHARGTFTGAHRDKEGLFEAASGGTVFLDEVGELPLQAQVKLLRFLDSGEFRRVGETRVRRADVRVLAATNRDLGALVAKGCFREDLLFRLNVFHVEVPALRYRRDDLFSLVQFFLKRSCGKSKVPVLSEAVRNVLESYSWPGNVRELKNLCDYMAARAWGRQEITLDDLTPALRQVAQPGEAMLSSYERERLVLEREQIVAALKKAKGRIIYAAKLLGMNRNTLAQRMKEHGILRESFKM